jgi:hypothetical protein
MAKVIGIQFRDADNVIDIGPKIVQDTTWAAFVPPAGYSKAEITQAELDNYHDGARTLGVVIFWDPVQPVGSRIVWEDTRFIVRFLYNAAVVDGIELLHGAQQRETVEVQVRDKDAVLLTGTLEKKIYFVWNRVTLAFRIGLVNGIGTMNIPVTKPGLIRFEQTTQFRYIGIGNAPLTQFDIEIVPNSNGGDLEVP